MLEGASRGMETLPLMSLQVPSALWEMSPLSPSVPEP